MMKSPTLQPQANPQQQSSQMPSSPSSSSPSSVLPHLQQSPLAAAPPPIQASGYPVSQSQQHQMPNPAASSRPANPNSGGGIPIQPEFFNRLPGPQRVHLLNLIARFKEGAMSSDEFHRRAREMLGEQMYTAMIRGSGSGLRQSSSLAGPPLPSRAAPAVLSHPLFSNNTHMPSLGGSGRAPSAPFPAVSLGVEGAPAEGGEVDVTKMDSASLQDVLQYSGVDLKAEADLILGEQEAYLSTASNSFNLPSSSAAANANFGSMGDQRLRAEYFFNLTRFRSLVVTAAMSRGINEVSESCVDLIAAALERRLANILCDLAAISRHRLDWDRLRFKIKIDNDPRKQLWLAEQIGIRSSMAQLEQQLFGSGSVASGVSNTAPSTSASITPASSAALYASGGRSLTPSILSPGSPASTSSVPAPAPPAKKSAGTGEKRQTEDGIIKTKLANVTAMAALGVQQKSWMSAASASPALLKNPSLATTAPSSQSAQDGSPGSLDGSNSVSALSTNAGGANLKIPLHFSQAPSVTPIGDRDLAQQLSMRTLSIRDLLYFCENDPHLCRSSLLISLLDVPLHP